MPEDCAQKLPPLMREEASEQKEFRIRAVGYICLFVVLLVAAYAENMHIVLVCFIA